MQPEKLHLYHKALHFYVKRTVRRTWAPDEFRLFSLKLQIKFLIQCLHFIFCCRMESTEKCEVVIQHFNGKYLKTPPGIPGESPLPCFTWLSHHPFLSWKIFPSEMRNFLSNSIMVISHLSSAGRLDRLCTSLFLTPDASCRGYGWIADGYRALSLAPLVAISLPPWWCCHCRLELLGQEKTLLIFTLMPLCCSLQST